MGLQYEIVAKPKICAILRTSNQAACEIKSAQDLPDALYLEHQSNDVYGWQN